MANYNEHTCLTCGQIFEYCRRCAVTPVVHKAEGFCSERCSEIFATLSKHGCNLITAEETLAALSAYNLDEITLTESIQAHINKIKAETTVNAEAVVKEEPAVTVESETITPEVTEEKPIVKSNNKNKKKKW